MAEKNTAGRQVKDRLLDTLIGFAGQKDWSKLTVTELIKASGVARASFYRNFKSVEEIIDYGIARLSRLYHQRKPFQKEDFHSREVMLYKFRFYREHAGLVLAFHRARASTALLDIITDCVIDANGDMPSSSISKYGLYYFAGAFYNMMLCWLQNGAKETPEAMADAFLYFADNKPPAEQ